MKKGELISFLKTQNESLQWELLFYSHHYKRYAFQSVPCSHIELFLNQSLEYLESAYFNDLDEDLAPIQEQNDKSELIFLDASNPYFDSDFYNDLEASINNTAYDENTDIQKIKGYLFVGRNTTTREIECVYLKQASPLYKFEKFNSKIFIYQDELLPINTDLKYFKLDLNFDILFTKNGIIIVTNKGYEILNIETKIMKHRDSLIPKIESLDIFDDFEIFKDMCNGKQATRAFLNISEEFIDAIRSDRQGFLIKARERGINIAHDKFDCSDKENIKKARKFICGKIMEHGYISNKTVEASNIREI